jgi:single-strand DNA-binding protein
MSVNKAIIVGNLGKDPELRYTPSGDAVCTFSVATSERYKDKSGQQQEKTEWHNIVVWRKLAEICGQYLHKGSQVYLEGKITSRSYEKKDGGGTAYISEIVCDQMKMLDRKGDGERSAAPARTAPASSAPAGGYEEPPFNADDEIPF